MIFYAADVETDFMNSALWISPSCDSTTYVGNGTSSAFFLSFPPPSLENRPHLHITVSSREFKNELFRKQSVFKINHNETSIKTMRILHQQETAQWKAKFEQENFFSFVCIRNGNRRHDRKEEMKIKSKTFLQSHFFLLTSKEKVLSCSLRV